MAINFTQAAGQVRLLISDVDEDNQVLADPVIAGYLARYGTEPTGPVVPRGPISRASADALDAIATSEALVSKVIRTGDGVNTDGAKVADALRKHAASLRARAAEEDVEDGLTGGYFGVAEFVPYRGRTEPEGSESFTY